MRFTKMNGAGNDFILLDAIAEPFDESAASALARSLCDRRRSIGADGLMLVTRAEGDAGVGDYAMRFYNSDGSPGEMCGNGARCICRYGYARGYAGPIQRVETTAGLVTGWRITEDQYRIRLNTPSVVELEKQLTGHIGAATLNLEAPASRIWRWKCPLWLSRTRTHFGGSVGHSGIIRRCQRARTSTSMS